MPHAQRSFRYGADTEPCRFVKLEAGEDHTVIPCVADDVAYGVSAAHSRSAPIPDASTLVAKEGETAQVFGPGEPCEVIAGATVAAGANVKPDANAAAITAGAGDEYSAVAVAGAAAGEKLKITIQRGTNPSA